MRRTVLLAALMALCVPVLAGPSSGTQPTATDNTFYAHWEEASGDLWFSNAVDEPDRWEGGVGSGLPGAGDSGDNYWWGFTLPMAPAPTADIAIDTSKAAAMRIVVTRYDAGASSWMVGTDVTVDGQTFLTAESELPVTNAGGGSYSAVFEWDLTPQLESIPAGADVRWHVRLGGVSTEWYLQMFEGATWMTWPIVDAEEEEPTTSTTSTTSSSSTSASSASSTTSSSSTSASSTTTPPAQSTTDAAGTTPAGQDSPALGVALLLCALAVGLLRRR